MQRKNRNIEKKKEEEYRSSPIAFNYNMYNMYKNNGTQQAEG